MNINKKGYTRTNFTATKFICPLNETHVVTHKVDEQCNIRTDTKLFYYSVQTAPTWLKLIKLRKYKQRKLSFCMMF